MLFAMEKKSQNDSLKNVKISSWCFWNDTFQVFLYCFHIFSVVSICQITLNGVSNFGHFTTVLSATFPVIEKKNYLSLLLEQ